MPPQRNILHSCPIIGFFFFRSPTGPHICTNLICPCSHDVATSYNHSHTYLTWQRQIIGWILSFHPGDSIMCMHHPWSFHQINCLDHWTAYPLEWTGCFSPNMWIIIDQQTVQKQRTYLGPYYQPIWKLVSLVNIPFLRTHFTQSMDRLITICRNKTRVNELKTTWNILTVQNN